MKDLGTKTDDHNRANRAAKSAICRAKNAEKRKFCEDLLERLWLRRMRALLEVWRAHYEKLSNKEFAWDREVLTDVSPVCEPGEKITVARVGATIGIG